MRSVSLFLCLCMLLSLCSCISVTPPEKQPAPSSGTLAEASPTEAEEVTSKEPDGGESPSHVIKQTRHYKIERLDGSRTRYEIYDFEGKTVHSGETDRPLDIYMLGENAVDIRFGTAPSYVRQFYQLKEHRLSREYSNLRTYTHELAICLEHRDSGAVIVAESLFDNSLYKEYTLHDMASLSDPIPSCELLEGKLYLKYLTESSSTKNTCIPIMETDRDYFADYASVVQLADELCAAMRYYDESIDYRSLFGFSEGQHAAWFDGLFSAITAFYQPRRLMPITYDVVDLNRDGTMELILLRSDFELLAILTSVDGKPLLLDHFTPAKRAFLDHKGQIYYVPQTTDADRNSITISQIPAGGTSIEPILEFGMDGTDQINGIAVQRYYKIENGERHSITREEYFDIANRHSCPSISLTQRCAHLRRIYLSAPYAALQASAKEAFLAVLQDQRRVYHVNSREFLFLKDYSSPYTAGVLSLADNLGYSLVDMDGDLVTELVLHCNETLILRYHEGTVCLYAFSPEEMLNLTQNGSFRRVMNEPNSEEGLFQLCFEGKEVQVQAIWRIVNDEKPNAEYYINIERTTKEELLRFQKKVPTAEAVIYNPLRLPFKIEITAEQALKLADAHWGYVDGDRDAACGTRYTCRVMLWSNLYDDPLCYHVVSLWEARKPISDEWEGLSDVYDVELSRHLLVDARTGECKPYIEYSYNGK